MDFCSFVRLLRGGAAAVELSEELSNITRKVGDTLKPASLTLTISVHPSGNGRIRVSDVITSKLPKEEHGTTTFFVTEDNELSRSMPGQPVLGLGDED